MYKFLDRDKFLSVINSWIREGSNLESVGTYQDADWVVLRGADGGREELYLFFTEEAYNAATAYEPWD